MKHMTFAHALAYIGALIVAGLVWLSNLDPTNVAFISPQAVKYATIAVSLAAAILAALHQAGIIPNAARQGSSSVTTIAKVIIPLVLILPFLHGCATLTKIETAISSPAAQPYLTAAADVAVATAESKGITAAQITSIAQQALAADSGTAATLATVAAVVNQQIAKLNLPAGDLAAAQVLEAALGVAIQAQIGTNASVAQAQATIAVVLNAVIAAANPGASTVPAAAPATTLNDVPAQNRNFALVESPQAVGGATAVVSIAALQAFWHIQTAAPVAAALTVLATLGAAYLNL